SAVPAGSTPPSGRPIRPQRGLAHGGRVSTLRSIGMALWGLLAGLSLAIGIAGAVGRFLQEEPWVGRAIVASGEISARVVSFWDPHARDDAEEWVQSALMGEAPLVALAPLGLVLLVARAIVGRRRFAQAAPVTAPGQTLHMAALDRRQQRQVAKQASALASGGRALTAAELSITHG